MRKNLSISGVAEIYVCVCVCTCIYTHAHYSMHKNNVHIHLLTYQLHIFMCIILSLRNILEITVALDIYKNKKKIRKLFSLAQS